MYEGDTLHPFEYDKARHKVVPNREFVKQFPNQAHEYYTDEQMLDAGHKDLPKHLARRKEKIMRTIAKEESKLRFEGNQEVRQKEVLA